MSDGRRRRQIREIEKVRERSHGGGDDFFFTFSLYLPTVTLWLDGVSHVQTCVLHKNIIKVSFRSTRRSFVNTAACSADITL